MKSAARRGGPCLADGRPLALRLLLEGDCPLHGKLHAHSDQEAGFQGIAAGLGEVWLEKVKLNSA